MKLHHYAHSSASYRVRIVLALKNIDIDYVNVDMPNMEQQSEAYAKLNPQALVPCLELDDGTVIGQSLAIIDYLDRLHPDPPIYPDNEVRRAQAQSLALRIACETSPIQAKFVQRYLASEYALNDDQIQSWLTNWIRRGLAPVEQYLRNRRNKSDFTMGDQPGVVDFFIVPQLQNAVRFGVDVSDYVELSAINAACLAHPAFQAAHPDKWE